MAEYSVPGGWDILAARTSPAARTKRVQVAAVWAFRSLLVIPFVLIGPEVAAGLTQQPDAAAHLSASAAGVLGTSTFLLFVLMLSVTPVQVVTGWHWHVVLRRDFGVGMFLVATTDLVVAALTTGDTFSGGLFARVAGRSFLFVGTLATLLVLPLAITANDRARRVLGRTWKRLHRLTYVVWALILLHLLLLFGPHAQFVNATTISVPLVFLRIPIVRGWWVAARRRRVHRVLRWVAVGLLVATFAYGFVPFVQDLALDGHGAFVQKPDDG